MKKFTEQIVALIPIFIFTVLAGTLFIFFYQNHITYEHFSGIIEILIWPTVVFFAILFFRRVFTYLFFSMEEFNFFGTKGKLKDIREVIEERVDLRIKEEKNQQIRAEEILKFSKELENVKKSKGDAENQANEYFELAKKYLSRYEKLSDQNVELTKELDLLRQERIDQEARREARNHFIRQRMEERNRRIHGDREKREFGGTSGVIKADKPQSPETRALDKAKNS